MTDQRDSWTPPPTDSLRLLESSDALSPPRPPVAAHCSKDKAQTEASHALPASWKGLQGGALPTPSFFLLLEPSAVSPPPTCKLWCHVEPRSRKELSSPGTEMLQGLHRTSARRSWKQTRPQFPSLHLPISLPQQVWRTSPPALSSLIFFWSLISIKRNK